MWGDVDQLRIGYQLVVECTKGVMRTLCCVKSTTPSLLPSPSLPPSLSCFLQPAWFLMFGRDRSFKLALTEKDAEFSNELREDCEVRGEGREGEGRGGEGRDLSQ